MLFSGYSHDSSFIAIHYEGDGLTLSDFYWVLTILIVMLPSKCCCGDFATSHRCLLYLREIGQSLKCSSILIFVSVLSEIHGSSFHNACKKTTNRVSSVSDLSLCFTAGFCA